MGAIKNWVWKGYFYKYFKIEQGFPVNSYILLSLKKIKLIIFMTCYVKKVRKRLQKNDCQQGKNKTNSEKSKLNLVVKKS